jgi:hypothetical protein
LRRDATTPLRARKAWRRTLPYSFRPVAGLRLGCLISAEPFPDTGDLLRVHELFESRKFVAAFCPS